jgi:glycosyltransferase involved in cell wall biosynthesis
MSQITVILPVYNVDKYIQLTLESINSQTLMKFDLVIVIDGSTDRSVSIIKSFVFREGIFVRIINQLNQGLSKARNIGALEAKTNLITFFDADDIYSKNHLTLMVNNKSQISFLTYETTNENNRYGTITKVYTDPSFITTNFKGTIALDLFIKRKKSFHCSSMVLDKNTFKQLDGFNSEFKYGEDFDFLIRLFLMFGNSEISLIDSKTYKYLIRQNSLMTSNNYQKYINFYHNFIKTLISNSGYLSKHMYNKILTRIITSIIRTSALYNSFFDYKIVIVSILENKMAVKSLYHLLILTLSYNKLIYSLLTKKTL